MVVKHDDDDDDNWEIESIEEKWKSNTNTKHQQQQWIHFSEQNSNHADWW